MYTDAAVALVPNGICNNTHTHKNKINILKISNDRLVKIGFTILVGMFFFP
jgi:hypothetical protein